MLLALSLTLFLTACADTVDENVQGTPTGGFKAEFDPGNSVVPFPTNLLFSGTTDGTLNIPLAGDSSDGPKIAMNALDGFSTVAPIKTTFSIAIDPSSINLTTVRLWEVSTDALKVVTGFISELTFNTDYTATVASTDKTGRTLAILPLKPLKPESTYLVILSKGLKSTDNQSAGSTQTYLSARIANSVLDGQGNSKFPSFTNEQAQALEPLRVVTSAQDVVMQAREPGLPNATALAWAFSTQSVGKVLQAARLLTTTGISSNINTTKLGTTEALNSALSGNADVYVGTITLPYYLSAPSTAAPTAPLNTNWQGAGGSHLTRFNLTLDKTADVTIPLLITIPNTTSNQGGTKPTGGWPIAIYQHGITGNRSQMLAIADALANGGIAAVAIDLPLHGLPSTIPPLYLEPNLTNSANIIGERTFDIDFVAQDPATGSVISQGPDGTPDSSGRHFINLTNLLTSRDNIRQGVADLMGLTAEIPNMDYDGGTGADFDSGKIFFIGHSLGGITGSVFLANESNASHSVLAFPGGGIAKLLDGSVSIGPEISAGLAAAGIIKGTPDYESFFGAAQTVLDSADPINYTVATLTGRGIMMLEVVGDGAANLPDQVVPNHVGTLANGFTDAPTGTVPGPLSGTDPLGTEMGLLRVDKNIATSQVVGGATPWLRFTAGDHGSILDPTSSLLVTTTMQTAAVGFLLGNGAGFAINGITNVGTVLE